LPPGYVVAQAEVSLKGFCAKCSTERSLAGEQSGATGLPGHYSKLKSQNPKRH
jgi:hypothetical protein